MPNPETTPQNISPEFADMLGVSSSLMETWGQVRMQHAKANEYYSGYVFQKRVEIENGDPTDAPLLYPVTVNLIKMLVTAMSDAELGEFEEGDTPIIFQSPQSEEPDENAKALSSYCNGMMKENSAATLFWEHSFDRNLYGGGAIKISPSFNNKCRLKLSRIPIDAFYPIFDPEDPNVLIECYIATYLYGEQARAKYAWQGSEDMVTYVEHWTPGDHKTFINKQEVSAYSGINPYGVVPVIYTPRQRTLDPFGESLVQDLYSIQDELNMRLADAGDALNYNMHPVRTGTNLPQAFSRQNYPLAPDAMWDLGRSINPDMAPKVEFHEIKNPVPEGLFKYTEFLYDWARTSSFAPPIAFGEDNGGGQRSGATLEIRLWPLLKAMKRSRSYSAQSINSMLRIGGRILKQKKFPDVDGSVIEGMLNNAVEPRYRRVLPRDQQQAVDEVVKLMSTRPVPSVSLETAQSILGRGPQELSRILGMLEELEEKGYWPEKPQVSDVGNEDPKDTKSNQSKPSNSDKE